MRTEAKRNTVLFPSWSVGGSEVKHIATSQYYPDLVNQSASVQENITQLLKQKQMVEQ